jgi:hypothetical protein
MPINQNQLDAINKSLLEMANLKNKISSDFKSYLDSVKQLAVLQENIKYLEDNIGKLTQKTADALAEKNRLQTNFNNAVASGIQQDIDAAKAALKAGKEAHKAAKLTEKDNINKLNSLREEKDLLAGIVKEANLANLAYVETGKIWNKLPGLAKSFYREIRDLAAVQMSKDIKQAELSMGILGKQSQYFSKGISKASESTIQLGFGISDIAKSQADYSEEIGRSSMMTELGMQAMAEMAKGTTLGVEGAASMAADMERFGVSVEGSRDLVQETVDIAAKMGVNSTKAIKELTKNLKVAQTFHFKGGIRGMAEMASYAAKMKVDLNGLTGMADKVFRPEGAVEMSARLQTMGGAFARLGNPFELMFKARNDFAAFTKDVASATAELAQFNESSGEFEISGLQLDRLREIATITGIGADQLSEMAKAGAKFNRIKSLIPGTFNEEDQELISSLAEMKDGQYKVRIDGQDLMLNEISQLQLETFKKQKGDLAERAKQAQTFDDAFTNLVNQFKSVLLPFVEELNKYFVPALIDFTKKLIDEGWIDKMKSIAADVGKLVVGIGKFATTIIDTFGVGGTVLAAALTTAVLNGAKWYAQGVQLGLGFNTVARAGGGNSGPLGTNIGPGAKSIKGIGGNIMRAGATKSVIGGGILSGIISGGMEYSEQKEKGKSESSAIGRGALKAAGSGIGAWGGAATGAALGAMAGPLGVPIGALIGGGLGAIGGGYLTDLDTYGVDDAVVKFNPQDKIVSMSDGMVASTNKGKIDDLVGGGGAMKSQKIEFGKLEISGTIKLEMPGNLVSSIDLANEPEFVRKLSTLISQQTRINLSGGKLSPNPY